MADDFAVTGADDFLKLSKALKHAGRTGLRNELNKGIRAAAKPLIGKTRAVARGGVLPDAGGLAAIVAREPQRVAVRTGRDPGVRLIVGRKNGGARATNRGVIRHPVFGSKRYVEQRIPGAAGWFDKTVEAEAPAVRGDLERVMQDMCERVIREAGL